MLCRIVTIRYNNAFPARIKLLKNNWVLAVHNNLYN